MATTCERCAQGPSGLEGHEGLALDHDGQPRYGQARGQHEFVCVHCGSDWMRCYEGSGKFRWERRAE
jgi:hypothetical protein